MRNLKVLILAIVSCILFGCNSSYSAVLTFDDALPPNVNVSQITNYDNFSWQGAYVVNAVNVQDGYYKGLKSFNNILTNYENTALTIKSNSLFNFDGAYLTAKNSSINFEVIGQKNGVQVYDNTITLAPVFRQYFQFNVDNIDTLIFSALTVANNCPAPFIVDNLTYSEPAPVPEPSLILLNIMSLCGLFIFKRRHLFTTMQKFA